MEEGVEVLLVQKDVTDRAALDRLMERIRSEMPPLAGVIHGAAVLDDASLPAMDMARFERVFSPKAQGAWNLHEATVAAGAEAGFLRDAVFHLLRAGLVRPESTTPRPTSSRTRWPHYRRQRGLPATVRQPRRPGAVRRACPDRNDAQDVIGLLESHGMLVMPLSDVLAKLEAVLLQQPGPANDGALRLGPLPHRLPSPGPRCPLHGPHERRGPGPRQPSEGRRPASRAGRNGAGAAARALAAGAGSARWRGSWTSSRSSSTSPRPSTTSDWIR